jgi:hypothetical protein
VKDFIQEKRRKRNCFEEKFIFNFEKEKKFVLLERNLFLILEGKEVCFTRKKFF